MKDPVDIIVIGYDLPEMEARCLSSVVQKTKWPFVLTYYNNFDTGRTLTQVWNQFVKNSLCKYICLLNNDTVVTSWWLTKMMETMTSTAKVGFVGPSTNFCNSPQKGIPTAEEATKHAGKTQVMKDPISGFCLLFRKDLWTELKGFDERYNFYGQESDFISRAQQKGYTAIWRQDAFVHHIGGQSIKHSNMDVETERKRAKDLYWRDRK